MRTGMRTLITGINGFTGHYLRAELVAQGHEVIGLQANVTDAPTLDAEMKRVQPDWVVHLAGIAFVGHGEANDFYRVNLMGARNLLAALAGCGKQPACVLLASSANVYGNAAEGMLDESTALSPANDYAVSKLAMEYMARLWMDHLPIVIARPFNYTGPGQALNFVIPKLVSHYARRVPVVELGNLQVQREFNDVRMVCDAYLALLAHGQGGEVYNVCSGRPHSLQHVIDTLAALTGHTLEVRVNTAFVRVGEVRRLCGKPAKLQQLCARANVALKQPGLREMLQWMLAEASR